MIPDETVEQVREAADIVGIIGEYVPLKRTGSIIAGRARSTRARGATSQSFQQSGCITASYAARAVTFSSFS